MLNMVLVLEFDLIHCLAPLLIQYVNMDKLLSCLKPEFP